MLNLLDHISKLDKQRIENYIYTYQAKTDYIGNKEYLKYWCQNKPRLFHLLGGKLIYEFDAEVEKDEDVLNNEIHSFITGYNKFFDEVYDKINTILWQYLDNNLIDEHTKRTIDNNFWILNRVTPYRENKGTFEVVKFKLSTTNKTLQIAREEKPLKLLRKILVYFGLFEEYKDTLAQMAEDYSNIFTDKIVRGTFCISIHPLDFMTMSDNDNGWTSCMSWVKTGCYCKGTVEMMNSNNVICCYIKQDKDFHFGEGNHKVDYWNSKKFRQLFYVTNDIIVSGKPYPYRSYAITRVFLDKIKELSEKNLNRTYQFGPQEYSDMKYIGSPHRIENHRYWIRSNQTQKHNIIFDTTLMYNDMFNDHQNSTRYYCYRNKVKKNTVISYSGKAPCLCCGSTKLFYGEGFDENYDDSYNTRYESTDALVCYDCTRKYTCAECGETLIKSNGYTIEEKDDKYYCQHCVTNMLKICPICNNTYNNLYYNALDSIWIVKKGDNYAEGRLCCCKNCEKALYDIVEKKSKTLSEYHRPYFHGISHSISEEEANEMFQEYLSKNLKAPATLKTLF